MAARAVFIGYEEGPILFNPTYRYNVGTDTYDSSEKMRIPAWTGELLEDHWAGIKTHISPRPNSVSRNGPRFVGVFQSGPSKLGPSPG